MNGPGTATRTETGLTDLRVGERRLLVLEEPVLEMPFGRLVKFDAGFPSRQPPLLIVAPLSGLRTALLYDMVAALIPDHQVHLLAWRDAANVAVGEGPFGLDSNISCVVDAVRCLAVPVHLFGLCQSALPALAATALLEQLDPKLCPRTLTLMGGKLDTRVSPTRLDRLTRSCSPAWFKENVVTRVFAPAPGAGRFVYASSTQAANILAYLARHFVSGGELARKTFADDGCDPLGHPFISLFLSVMNVPAELFLDMIALVFQQSALACHTLQWRDGLVEPAAIRRTALLTIEGSDDDISGSGQTRAAHALCTGIPSDRRDHHQQPGVGHFGLFHGRVWRTQIMPAIRDFIRANARPGAQRPRRWR